eukprot:2889729-Rhodomonas_salina.1
MPRTDPVCQDKKLIDRMVRSVRSQQATPPSGESSPFPRLEVQDIDTDRPDNRHNEEGHGFDLPVLLLSRCKLTRETCLSTGHEIALWLDVEISCIVSLPKMVGTCPTGLCVRLSYLSYTATEIGTAAWEKVCEAGSSRSRGY